MNLGGGGGGGGGGALRLDEIDVECVPCVRGRLFEADLFFVCPGSLRACGPSKLIAREGSHYVLNGYNRMFKYHANSSSTLTILLLQECPGALACI